MSINLSQNQENEMENIPCPLCNGDQEKVLFSCIDFPHSFLN